MALMIATSSAAPLQAQEVAPTFDHESDFYRVFGELPRRGELHEILQCAAANEVFWVSATRDNPSDAEAHDAKPKAGWYAAVALRIFAVDSDAVTKSVEAATREPRAAMIALAKRCRKAPETWRD